MSALMEFTSHIQGKNAKVAIYPDRIEWERGGLSMKKLTAGAATGGISLLKTGVSNKSSEMIPIKAIGGVSSKKGMMNTVVSVASSSGTIDFRCSHAEADKGKALLQQLISA